MLSDEKNKVRKQRMLQKMAKIMDIGEKNFDLMTESEQNEVYEKLINIEMIILSAM